MGRWQALGPQDCCQGPTFCSAQAGEGHCLPLGPLSCRCHQHGAVSLRAALDPCCIPPLPAACACTGTGGGAGGERAHLRDVSAQSAGGEGGAVPRAPLAAAATGPLGEACLSGPMQDHEREGDAADHAGCQHASGLLPAAAALPAAVDPQARALRPLPLHRAHLH